ncbi:MAG: RluA family pseudouridine synthase [Puniceicoccales bacterium]|jgi:23S rRNA pseudouridine1911/1915/1917 synthase|nr:RluA family pseudouridine synthase [Puniceicoccales bacterium]
MENAAPIPPAADVPADAPIAAVAPPRVGKDPHIAPSELQTWVVAEDDDFIVLNKPGNIVCHPSKDGPWSSVSGAVKAWRQMKTLHLVSRLDRETSGVLLIAKNLAAARLSQIAIQERQVSKTYLAVLCGEMREPVLVDEPLDRDPASPVAVKHCVSHAETARTAVTFFEPLFAKNGSTFARVTPHTGRTHQIRVHAQWLGFPVAGDKLYGPDELLYLEFTEHGWTDRHAALLETERQMLHAFRLEFKAPNFQRVFEAPPSPDMLAFCTAKFGAMPTGWGMGNSE